MPQSLAELRAQNKAEEEAAAKKEEKPEEKPEEEKAEEVEAKPETQPEEAPEEKAEEEAEKKEDAPEDDSWMKPDESDPEDAKFTSHDVANVRRKYKAEARQAKEESSAVKAELENVKKELEALKTGKQTLVPATAAGKPRRDQFKTDEEFVEALTDYKISLTTQQTQSERAAEERKRQIDDRNAKTAVAVDQHYERAAKLAEKSGIKPEAYQAADLKVRQAIDSIFPSTGDAVADALISSLGSGSEKVFYHLGVNTAKRAEMVRLLTEDRSGIRAAVYLGKLNTELTTPVKRETKAPDPIDEVKGDKAGSGNSSEKLKRRYKEAHDKGDVQAAFAIRRQAKKAGINTQAW